jgi:hypothetical protein
MVSGAFVSGHVLVRPEPTEFPFGKELTAQSTGCALSLSQRAVNGSALLPVSLHWVRGDLRRRRAAEASYRHHPSVLSATRLTNGVARTRIDDLVPNARCAQHPVVAP